MKERKRHAGEIDLFARHLVELGDRDLDRILDRVEVGRVGLLVPLEIMRVVDEVLHHEVLRVAEIGGDLGDLVERGDRGAEDVEHRERDLPLPGGPR